MSPRRFEIFGPDHLAALALTVVGALALVAVARRHRRDAVGLALRRTLAALMLAGVSGYVGAELRLGQVALVEFLPLHLCDAAIFVGVFALVTRHALACELLYFWALAGSTLAMVTPEVIWAFPDWRFVVFFLMHGLTVIAAAVLTFGFGCRPRRGAAWRAFFLTLAYAAGVALLNLLFDANFLYLRAKPVTPTLLDRFGPWPWYLVVAGAVGLALFHVLAIPFRTPARTREAPGRG